MIAIIIYTSYGDYEKIASGYIAAYSHRHFADEASPADQLPLPPHIPADDPRVLADQVPADAAPCRGASRPRGLSGRRSNRPSHHHIHQSNRDSHRLSLLLQRSVEADIFAKRADANARRAEADARRVASQRDSYELERQIHHDDRKYGIAHTPREPRSPRYANCSVDYRPRTHSAAPARRGTMAPPPSPTHLASRSQWTSFDIPMEDPAPQGPPKRAPPPKSNPASAPSQLDTQLDQLIWEAEQSSLPFEGASDFAFDDSMSAFSGMGSGVLFLIPVIGIILTLAALVSYP